MQETQINTHKKMNMDSSPKYLKADEAYYKLNVQNSTNLNGENSGAALGVGTSMPANIAACEMQQPAGENYTVGTFKSEKTNEVYNWVLNSNGVNYISRVNSDGKCEVVYVGDCLKVSADPKRRITQFRAHMRREKICSNRDGKQLVWVDGEFAGMLDVEASIATNFFTTPFFKRCEDPCAYISLCVPEINGCLTGEFVPLPQDQRTLANNILDTPIQVMIRHIYYDGRASEWSDRSTTYYQDVRSCFGSDEGFSRCIKFRVPVGNPMVDKIEFAFSTDNGKSWQLADTIEKYKKYNSSQQKWYERELSETVASTFSDTDCSFDYFFCNDKQCQPIDPTEYTRTRNPFPRGAQGILEVADALGFYNYIDGVCPVDKLEIEKIKIETDCSATRCQPEMAKVTVRAVIHNLVLRENQFIYRYGGKYGLPDDTNDTAYFGGATQSGPYSTDIQNGMDQNFNEKTRGFIAYIEGHGISVEMKQKLNIRFPESSVEKGVVAGMADSGSAIRNMADARSKGFYQEAVFYVPKGTKGFIRLTSHKETKGNEDASTFVVATMRRSEYVTVGFIYNKPSYDYRAREIYFDTSSGDQELQDIFVIQDHATPNDTGYHTSIAYEGYIKDISGRPVEGAEVWADYNGNYARQVTTDHNGFYHFSGVDSVGTANIRAEKDCGDFDIIKDFILDGQYGSLTKRDYVIGDSNYANNFYETLSVPVLDCNGLPVPSARVALSGSKWRITDSSGICRFVTRNYSSRNRKYVAVFINFSGCVVDSCDQPGLCIPKNQNSESNASTCFDGKPTQTSRAIKISTNNIGEYSRGLKSGGIYPFAVVVQGDCGRLSAAYELPQVVIDKTQKKGKLSFCSLSYDATGMMLPSWGKSLKILRGENINTYELQWVVDKIERTNDGNLKLTIQSLNDYNEKYFFKTNTKYQWLAGDRVEFIRNGDNLLFDDATYGLLNYQTISPFNDEVVSGVETKDDANYFNQLLIKDDGRLNDLKKGAIIELQRRKQCTTEPAYFEICASIPLVPVYNGDEITHTVLENETGWFNTFDTFFVRRNIGSFSGIVFEHHSPSDFWGDHVSDIGKVHFLNKYENERRNGRWMTLNTPNQYNFFGNSIKRFDAEVQGDITAMSISDGKVILALCEYDNFIAEAADDLLRVGNDGVIRALPSDAVVSQPQSKISGRYGCQYEHIGSVYFGDGYATYCDGMNHAFIIHDYNMAKVAGERMSEDGTIYSQCNTYFKKRLQEIEFFNRSQTNFLDHYRVSAGFNMASKKVYLTIKTLRQPSVNNENAPYKTGNETIMYDPFTNDFVGFTSPTPEAYSELSIFDGKGCAMVMFYNSVPYITPIITDRYNEFFGIPCDQHIGVCINKFPEKVKIPLSFELQDSDMMWYVSDVRTEDQNFRSEIPPVRIVRSEKKWNSAFLNNINSRGGLYNGEAARGYYTKVLFTRDNTDDLKYQSINNAKRVKYSEIDLILFNFRFSEQSGYITT